MSEYIITGIFIYILVFIIAVYQTINQIANQKNNISESEKESFKERLPDIPVRSIAHIRDRPFDKNTRHKESRKAAIPTLPRNNWLPDRYTTTDLVTDDKFTNQNPATTPTQLKHRIIYDEMFGIIDTTTL